MPYVAPAVHFDGATYLHINSLGCTDNGKFSMSVRFKGLQANGVAVNPFFVTDPAGHYNCFATFNNSGVNYQVRSTLAPGSFATEMDTASVPIANDTNWHWLLYSYDGALPGKPTQLYIDGLLVTTDFTVAATIAMNALSCFVGSDGLGDTLKGDISDLWIAPGVSLLNGSGVIPSATMALFSDTNGRPTDPSGFPAGAILFSGDSTTFATNQGSGGAFTLVGAFTNASTSPSSAPIGVAFGRRTRAQTGTPQYGWSDPNSNYVYLLSADDLDSDFTFLKIDRTINDVVQTVVYPSAPVPSLTSITAAVGMTGPWSDNTRLFAVGYDGVGPFDWYIYTINKATLAVSHTAKVATANAQLPANNAQDLAVSADGAYLAFCSQSSAGPIPGHIAIYRSSDDGFAITTDAALGIVGDNFRCCTMDAANFIYCFGESGKVYKLSFDVTTLVATLVATYNLNASFPAPAVRWSANACGYRQTAGTLLGWYDDGGGANKAIEITTAGAVVRGAYDTAPLGQQITTPPQSGWNNSTIFCCFNQDMGSAADIVLVDVSAGTTTTYPATDWGMFTDCGLTSVYDGPTQSVWTSAEGILGGGLTQHPIAQFLLGPYPPVTTVSGSVSEGAAAADALSGVMVGSRSVAEAAAASDSLSGTLHASAQMTEAANAVDAPSAVLIPRGGRPIWVPVGPFRDSIYPN